MQFYLQMSNLIQQIMTNFCKEVIIIPQQNNDVSEYELESILDRKNSKTGLMYLVKWRGLNIHEATWQPVTNLFNSLEAVKQYEKQIQLSKMNNNQEAEQKESNNQSNKYKLKKKRIFKQHLIFPKQIKFQGKREIQSNGGKKDRFKKIIYRKCQKKFNILKHKSLEEVEILDSGHDNSNKQFFNDQQKQLDSFSRQLPGQNQNKQINMKLNQLNQENLSKEKIEKAQIINSNQIDDEYMINSKFMLKNLNPNEQSKQIQNFGPSFKFQNSQGKVKKQNGADSVISDSQSQISLGNINATEHEPNKKIMKCNHQLEHKSQRIKKRNKRNVHLAYENL